MMRTLSEIVKRMGETPEKAGKLVRERGQAADALHKALDDAKSVEIRVAGEVAAQKNRDGKPVYVNAAMREFETARRLAEHKEYQELQGKIETYRNALRTLDAALESLRLRAASDQQVVALATALVNAGRVADAEAILGAYAGTDALKEQEAPKGQVPAEAPKTQANDGTETAVVTVLEARAGATQGTIRAYCEAPDGRHAVFGKNGVGQTLAGAVGRQVEIRYRRGDKGLIALAAKVVA